MYRTIIAAMSLLFVLIGVPPFTCLAQGAAATDSAAQKPFVHPGLLHTDADFGRMKAKVAAGEHPWVDDWNVLIANPHAQLGYKPRPVATVIRGAVPGQNYTLLYNDIAAAYQLGLRWKVSGDTAYADKAVSVLNAWSSVLTQVSGNSDRFLASGIYGYEFANAAETMRTYPGWSPADFGRFQTMMLTVFYPMNHDFLTRHNGAAITNYWANWDLCNMASMEAIGVLCDRRDIYNEALQYFYTGMGNGAMDKAVYYVHPGNLGQWQESGRDQGHNTLGIALMGPMCEAAWNQGDDLYGYDNNRFLAGAEYVAKYNLGLDVPYEPYAWGTGQNGARQTQPVISAGSRGTLRPCWELIVNHYANLQGIAAPYSAMMAGKVSPEGGGGNFGPNSGGYDQLGFGTLTDTIEPQIASPKPSGLTAHKNGSTVVLSWWGAQGATTYNVKRAPDWAGPFTVIASGVTDLLTYADKSPKPGPNIYVVTAMRAGKETGPSNEVRVVGVPAPHTELKFDEGAGTKAADSVNNANPGTLMGGATWVSGKRASGLALNGSGAYVALPAGATSSLGDFTIATWVYLNDAKPWSRIFDFGDDRGRYMYLTSAGGTGKPRFAVSTVYGYNEQGIDSSVPLPINKWVQVAVTLSGRVGTIYVNGVPAGSNPAIDFPPFQIGSTTRNWIGRSQFPTDPYLNGKIDDFRIYDGVLTPRMVAELAATGHVH